MIVSGDRGRGRCPRLCLQYNRKLLSNKTRGWGGGGGPDIYPFYGVKTEQKKGQIVDKGEGEAMISMPVTVLCQTE